MNRYDFLRLKEAAEKAIDAFTTHCADVNPKGKTAAVLVWEKSYGTTDLYYRVGKPYTGFRPYICLDAVRNKFFILDQNSEFITSYEGRDGKMYWGGAVCLPNGEKVGLSGLPELADEACVLAALLYCGIVDTEYVFKALPEGERRELFTRIAEAMEIPLSV